MITLGVYFEYIKIFCKIFTKYIVAISQVYPSYLIILIQIITNEISIYIYTEIKTIMPTKIVCKY
jgi:hypothetical protein